MATAGVRADKLSREKNAASRDLLLDSQIQIFQKFWAVILWGNILLDLSITI